MYKGDLKLDTAEVLDLAYLFRDVKFGPKMAPNDTNLALLSIIHAECVLISP